MKRLRSGLKSQTQILNPFVLNEFLKVHKSILSHKFPEPRRLSKRDLPRIGCFWKEFALSQNQKQDQISLDLIIVEYS